MEFKKFDELAEKFISRTTPSNYPFIQKVFTAYVKSMYESDNVQTPVNILSNRFDPLRDMFYFLELHPFAGKYRGFPYEIILAYSTVRKDVPLFELAGYLLFGARTVVRYGPMFSSDFIFFLDEFVDHYLDDGYYMDMEGFEIPVVVYFLDYSMSKKSGIDRTASELYDLITKNFDFFSLIKPARVMLAYIPIPHMVYDEIEHNGLIIRESPFLHPEQVEILKTMSISDINSNYLQETSNANEFRIRRTLNPEDKSILFDIEVRDHLQWVQFSSSNPALSPILFEANWKEILRIQNVPLENYHLTIKFPIGV